MTAEYVMLIYIINLIYVIIYLTHSYFRTSLIFARLIFAHLIFAPTPQKKSKFARA